MDTTATESGITLQFGGIVSLIPLCSSATATITDIQESMDGLGLTCYNAIAGLEFNSTVMFDVIGKWKFVDCLNLFLTHLQYMWYTVCYNFLCGCSRSKLLCYTVCSKVTCTVRCFNRAGGSNGTLVRLSN